MISTLITKYLLPEVAGITSTTLFWPACLAIRKSTLRPWTNTESGGAREGYPSSSNQGLTPLFPAES